MHVHMSSIAVFVAALFAAGTASAMQAFPRTLTSQQSPASQVAAAPAQQTAAIPPELRAVAPQAMDYAANQRSDVFGANLFTGSFARGGTTGFNPDYLLTVGDRVQVRLWGGFNFDSVLPVDPKGNIFLPQIGPVKVAGVRNQDLQGVLDTAMQKVFRSNVFGYASLAAAQPVRIFVGGFVHRPGMYDGTSMDSLLHYLDQAGGIDAERGSFLDVVVKRGTQVRANVSLYDFLLDGRIPQVQLNDGDVIFIPARRNMVSVRGLAANAKRFEFGSDMLTMDELSRLSRPRANATHVRVVRNSGTVKDIDYVPLANAGALTIGNGDEVEFTADKKPGTITVRVEGEHQSAQEYVLPYGARMGELMQRISFSERSDAASLQLFRTSVKERQREMLETSLRSLESSLLTARSGTSDEAQLRKEESELVMQWVERARKIEPSGQVLIAGASATDQLLLENGDIIKVPSRDGLVLVSGEVLFPNAVAHDPAIKLDGYIKRAGGYTQNAEGSRVIVAHRDGSFDDGGKRTKVRAGDQILVLPKVDVKSRQVFKDMTQIVYQIAIAAKVVLGL